MIEHAKNELKQIGLYEHKIGKSVLQLIETFTKQKNSKKETEKIKLLFNKLVDFQQLSEITGEETEWLEISKNTYQNKKLKTLFKQKDKSYFVNAIIWETQDHQEIFAGIAKTKDGKEISCRQVVKSFPFVPKTFRIEVENILGDLLITNQGEKELEEVFSYYDFNLED